ncbi:MAG: glycosyl hydrolase, partial [bacterium]|nr:glycosyl hydrolase [bacterium]
MFIERAPLAYAGGSQGDAFYSTPNPPVGAVFTYYLKETLTTGKGQRRKMEKKLGAQDKSIPFPGWDVIRKETREDKPGIILTVKDENGQVVRRVTGPVTSGIHRVSWDFRYPSVAPVKLKVNKDLPPWAQPAKGPLVVPGTFSVSMAKLVNGVLTPLVKPQTFVVESLGLQSLPAKDREKLLAFQAKAGRLQRAVSGAIKAAHNAVDQLKYIKKAL